VTPLEAAIETPLAEVARQAGALDCLVVGSGTAGVTTALALAERGFRSVVLEAGPLLLLQHLGELRLGGGAALHGAINESVRYPVAWAEAQAADAPAHETSGWAAVGGRSLFWTGMAPRPNPWDLDDWPLDFAELLPWLEQAEGLIGVTAPAPPAEGSVAARACRTLAAAGYPARPAPLAAARDEVPGGVPGDAPGTTPGRRAARFDSAVARLLASDHFGRLETGAGVALAAQAEALRLEVEGSRVTGLVVRDRRSGRTEILRGPPVVLAGGALQSTRLALASGLDAIDPAVGRGVRDHLFVQTTARRSAPGEADGTGEGLSLFLDALPERPFHVQVQGWFEQDWYRQSHSTLWLEAGAGGRHLMLAAFGVAAAEGHGRLDPDAARAGGMAGLRVLHRRGAADRRRLEEMRDALERVAAALGAEALRSRVHPPGGALHEIGGLSMGAKPAAGVTDPFGRFRRLDGLSVADAACFPSQGSANPYLTITAWSLRHAAALADTLPRNA